MATTLDGRKIANEIRAEIKADVDKFKGTGVEPKLSVILVGDDPASVWYANAKKKLSQQLGIAYDLHRLPETCMQQQLMDLIEQLNLDPSVHGILLELPLPKHLNTQQASAAIDPLKDVDGVTPYNRGQILSGGKGLFPATPQSCVEILLRSGVELEGKNAVLVGRGETVGKPLVFLLLKHNPTITICHSRTRDLGAHTRQGEILIVAVGRPAMIRGDMIREGAVVVDAGINDVEGKMVGDVAYDEAVEKASMITPVPGGVGSLTTTLIMRNVLDAIRLQQAADQGGE